MTKPDIEYIATVDGSDYNFRIQYDLGYVDNLRDGLDWNVVDWSVTHVDDRPNLLGAFWSEQLNAENVCNAIMENESD